MIMEMVGSEEVGIYSVAVRLTEVWIFIPTALYLSVFPSILEAKQTSDELYYERLQKFYNLMALVSYAIAIPTTLLSQWIVLTFFGEAYARAGLMLAVLIWSGLFWNLEMARGAFLTSMNWNRFYLLSVFLGCIMNIVLNYFLIPRYGGMGAVVSSLCAYWFAAHGSCFISRKMYRTGFMLSKAVVCPKIW
jgi:O-antigen/teichoic acid export membrane protein